MKLKWNNESSHTPEKERLAYSIQEATDMLGVDYFSVYRLIQRGKFLITRSEPLRMLNEE